jgi:hypothetical protein
MAKTKKSTQTPEAVRQWSLDNLMGTVEEQIDLSRCGDPAYLSTLSRLQTAKIKRISYDRLGNISSVEPTPLVDLVVAAANIAGTREAMKAQAEREAKEGKENGAKYRSNSINLNISGQPKEEKKPQKTEKKKDITDIMQNIGIKNP